MKKNIILILGIVICSCSSAPKDLDHHIEQIAFKTLKFRRPEGIVVDPKAGPGGVDYQRPVGESLDCQSLSVFYDKIPFKEATQCLKNADDQATLKFKVIRDPEPVLKIDFDEDNPHVCFKRYFESIYVPREIVFLAKSPQLEMDKYSCFSSSSSFQSTSSCFNALSISGLDCIDL